MIRVALPAGDLREPVGRLLDEAGLSLREYVNGSRSYFVGAENGDGVRFRVFRERDIPIQIALGNYDLGICGLARVEDLLRRYPSDALAPVCDLGIGRSGVYAAASPSSGSMSLADWAARSNLRIVSEYPDLAEALARHLRAPSYRVLSVWGAAEAYPPEDADLAVIAAESDESVRRVGLEPLHRLIESSAWLVANRESVARKDLSKVMAPLLGWAGKGNGRPALLLPPPAPTIGRRPVGAPGGRKADVLRLALPDGHQQKHAAMALQAAGLGVVGYDSEAAAMRPQAEMPGLEMKVIRPQDMPQQVALGHFDLAVTGRDWLLDHKCCFPSSPVEVVVDLEIGRYSIAAVVSEDVRAGTLGEALADWRRQGKDAIRVASEYVNVADHCARSRHVGRYKVIPISGASEGFVPEDADLLIEGTETGATLAANRLKVVERLFDSTTCLIAHRGAVSGRRRGLKARVIDAFRRSIDRAG